MSDTPVSELRIDPVTGRQVYISEGRADRPSDYVGFSERSETSVSSETEADCPFCAGHEKETPPATAELLDENGQWQVRVIPNKYPAVRWETENGQIMETHASGVALPARGAQEVIVESPDHLSEITELSSEQFASILATYRERVSQWLQTDGIRQVILFKNSGYAAGASLHHLHSQLIAVPHVWPGLQAELTGARAFYDRSNKCVYCDLIAKETSAGKRVVAENEQFLAFCAFAGRQPYETWILPKLHASSFPALADSDLVSLAPLLQELVARLQACLAPLSYNLILHTAPAGGDHAASYHWHWELIPRTTRLAGLEFGSGAHINPLAPERAASFLRLAEC